MYVCMFVCVYVCMGVYVCICVCMCVCVHVCACVYVCMHLRMYVHTEKPLNLVTVKLDLMLRCGRFFLMMTMFTTKSKTKNCERSKAPLVYM